MSNNDESKYIGLCFFLVLVVIVLFAISLLFAMNKSIIHDSTSNPCVSVCEHEGFEYVSTQKIVYSALLTPYKGYQCYCRDHNGEVFPVG